MKITLKTLPQATAQEVFDQVALHLLTQNQKSSRGTACQYKLGALKCAAGCLISDNEYSSLFEDNNWYGLTSDVPGFPQNHKELIMDLQAIHDNKMPVIWPQELVRVAELFNLSPSVVLNFTRNEEETSK